MSRVEVTRAVAAAPLDTWVVVPEAVYRLGDEGTRVRRLGPLRLGRHPVTNAQFAAFVAATGHPTTRLLGSKLDAAALEDHPVTDVTYDEACAYAAHHGARLPTGDEWEAAARGTEQRIWPWGDTYDPERCNGAEACWGWTVAVDAHPRGAASCGAEQLAGNVWEWVADEPDDDGWRTLKGGSYLDTSWGLRAARSLPADPHRATATTGFRLAHDRGGNP